MRLRNILSNMPIPNGTVKEYAMGTRNLVCVVQDGKYKVGQYGQWDGYPSGQGVIVLSFLKKIVRSPKTLGKFGEKVSELTEISDEALDKLWTEAGSVNGSISCEKADIFGKSHPEFSRDTGAKILGLIYQGKINEISNQVAFVGDGLFCEWAYVIDLDKKTFEIYQGFNKKPLTKKDRFYTFTAKPEKGEPGYYPAKVLQEYRFNKLPTMKQFLVLEKGRDEDDKKSI